MWHAQPDFGTFELWAYGKILMPDAGAYTYSGDEEIERLRAYFKETARHNAITLDDKNYNDPQPKVLAWKPTPENGAQLLSVQHEAYEGLARRRDIIFVEEKFFIIVDEVTGPATGCLTLRNCLGQGALTEVAAGNFVYQDGEAGLCLLVFGPDGSKVSVDEDWYSEAFRERHSRPVVRLDVERSPEAQAQRFVTVIYPFSGKVVPEVRLKSATCICIDGKDYMIN